MRYGITPAPEVTQQVRSSNGKYTPNRSGFLRISGSLSMVNLRNARFSSVSPCGPYRSISRVSSVSMLLDFGQARTFSLQSQNGKNA